MVEALYYFTYNAYLNGDLEKTKTFFEILKEEYNAAKNKDLLDRYQYSELKKIRAAIATGNIPKCGWLSEVDTPKVISSDETDIKQQDLVKRIDSEAVNDLRQCLQSNESLYLDNIEHPCGDHGRVDMVYRDVITAYPVEIKKDKGRHDLVGQIAKYTLYFRMLLNLKHFKTVQPVTICRCYDRHALAELKRMSVVTLRYGIMNGRVVVKAV